MGRTNGNTSGRKGIRRQYSGVLAVCACVDCKRQPEERRRCIRKRGCNSDGRATCTNVVRSETILLQNDSFRDKMELLDLSVQRGDKISLFSSDVVLGIHQPTSSLQQQSSISRPCIQLLQGGHLLIVIRGSFFPREPMRAARSAQLRNLFHRAETWEYVNELDCCQRSWPLG